MAETPKDATGRPGGTGRNPGAGPLPPRIPVFPLPGALLLPRGRLPLNIFEFRYLNMVEDALGQGRIIGMVQPREDAEDKGPAAPPPAIYNVGCAGRITTFAETGDGRFLITLTGVSRFAIAEELPGKRGYRRVLADYTPFAMDRTASHEEGTTPPLDRQRLIAAMRAYLTSSGIEANWEAIDKSNDESLVTTLVMSCPFDVREKQALLESPTLGERGELLIALLQMGAHGGPHGGGFGGAEN